VAPLLIVGSVIYEACAVGETGADVVGHDTAIAPGSDVNQSQDVSQDVDTGYDVNVDDVPRSGAGG
jgi:hypothetical protein